MIVTFLFYNASVDVFDATVAAYHSDSENVSGSTLEAFANIQPRTGNSMRLASVGSFSKEMSTAGWTSDHDIHWATTTFTISPTITSRIFAYDQKSVSILKEKCSLAQLSVSLIFQSVPPVAPVSNSLGFFLSSQPERNLVNLLIDIIYEDPAITCNLESEIQNLLQGLDELVEEEGLRHESIYLNYAAS